MPKINNPIVTPNVVVNYILDINDELYSSYIKDIILIYEKYGLKPGQSLINFCNTLSLDKLYHLYQELKNLIEK